MVKKGSSFARIVVIILALVMGLGIMGVGVSYWSDAVETSGTVNTGAVSANITYCGGCSHPAIISCSVVDSDTLEVTVEDAAELSTDYSCNFDIKNSGTMPLKIQSIVKSAVPTGVTANVTGVVVGTPIEPGVTKGGTVHVSLTQDAGLFTFTVTFNVIPWNQ